MREFVGEGLRREGVIDIGHRAQPADADMILRRAIFGAMIGKVEGQIDPSLAQVASVSVGGIQREGRTDGRKHGALQPGGRLSLFVQRGLHVHGGDGVIVVELDVVFAAPHHLDRLAEFLRQEGGLGRVVRLRFAPEAAAQ